MRYSKTKEGRAEYRANNRDRIAVYNREYAKANKERLRIYIYDWRARNLAKHLFNHTKRNAKYRNIEFTITPEDFERMLEPMRCSVTGMKLRWGGPDRDNPWIPSPDRIDQTKGYIPGNVRIVSWIYNRARGRNSDNDVLIMAAALIAAQVTGGPNG